MSETTEERIVELESRIAIQERTLEQVNEVVLAQGKLLEQLRGRIRDLADRLQETAPDEGEEPPPPHY